MLAPPEGEAPTRDIEEIEGEKYRPLVRMLPVSERLKGFSQVELGFDEENAIEEAKRCLWCDLEEH